MDHFSSLKKNLIKINSLPMRNKNVFFISLNAEINFVLTELNGGALQLIKFNTLVQSI